MNLNIGCSLTLNPRPPTACTLTPTLTVTRKTFRPAKLVDYQVTHSMSPEKIELFKSLEPWADANILVHLKPVEKSWQPQDFLPDPASPGFYDQLEDLRERSSQLSDDYFVVLVGDMVTEESVPTYMTIFNTLDGTKDETCCSQSPWALWNRGWIAEENRHGDLLSKYLYLTGRVDMVSVQKTIQYVFGSGMDFQWENNPYLGFVYTSFQEMAAFTSHGNTARLAKDQGNIHLAKLCGTIASDEKRHETAYLKVVAKLFEVDPDTSMLAFANMTKKRIYMPVKLMYDGQDDNLYDHFSAVAQRIGSFTSRDYAEIVESLVQRWKVDKITTGLSGEGRRAQEYLCGLAPRLLKLEEKARDKAKKTKPNYAPFSWIFGKELRI